MSGEHSQDHWSSGLRYHFDLSDRELIKISVVCKRVVSSVILVLDVIPFAGEKQLLSKHAFHVSIYPKQKHLS